MPAFIFKLTDSPPHEMTAGQYRPSVNSAAHGGRGAQLCCPVCERRISLGDCHVIDDKGQVSPSFVCTHKNCTFHQTIELEAYQFGG